MENKGIVIFGGTGDLAYRKLFPTLYNIHCLGILPKDYKIIGIGRRDYENNEYIEIVRNWMKDYSRIKFTEKDFKEFEDRILYFKMDMYKNEEYSNLIKFLEKENLKDSITYYYAVSPSLFQPITEGLSSYDKCVEDTKVIIEKPFGENIESAEKTYNDLKRFFKEENIYYIDHYLGKEMIINIMTLRFANAIFKAVWNKEYIEKVEINAFEEVGVESRGGYYDKSGALADMVQNHLFQIMSIVAMEQPENPSSECIKKSQLELFKDLKKIEPEKIDEYLLMGQYKGYREEEKVDPKSNTETYVSLKLEVDNERWKGVPFYLRTGKKLEKRESEVIVTFKSVLEDTPKNHLIIKVQPDEGVKVKFNIKKPGTERVKQEVEMDFCQSCIIENRENTPEAYERLLRACMDSDKTLFSQWEQIKVSWEYINELVKAYKKYSNKISLYEIGSKGPKENF